MKYIITGASFALVALLAACSSPDPNALGSGADTDPQDTAAGQKNTFDHAHESVGGQNGITDLSVRHADEAAIAGPSMVARLHGSQKIAYAALGRMLTDFGVPVTATTGRNNGNNNGNGNNGAATTQTASQLFAAGKSALGAPVFTSRTPEMTSPSTSALAKEYDVFIAGASDIVANIGSSKRCPGVVLKTAGKFTEDGITCLLGKPATPEHMALADKLVAETGDETKGTAIAVATLLAAAHISE